MKRIRMAIIGAGQIARVTHIPNYLQMDEVELTAICDTNEESAQVLSAQFQIPTYFTDYRAMLHTIKPDAVTVCVPNKFHRQITVDALNSGCHVLCEKPPAITAFAAGEMEQAALDKKRLLSYGFHFRHSQEVSIIKQLIDTNQFGDIYHARVQWLRRRGIPGWGNFTNKELQGGGPLIDIGAHMLDAAMYLMNYPEVLYVSANAGDRLIKSANAGLMGTWDKSHCSVEDSLFGFIQFQNNASLSIETSFALNMKERDLRNVQLFGDKLGASLFPLEVFGEQGSQLMDINYPFIETKDRHFACAHNFIQAVLEKEALLNQAWQGTYIQKIIEALYQSAAEKRPVMLK